MVIYANLDTNVKTVVEDAAIDEMHGVRKDGSSRLIIKEGWDRPHHLNPSSGELWLGNIQCPERPVVLALVGNYRLEEGRFMPTSVPSREEYHRFPTLFELERIAQEPVIIRGITRLSSDGVHDFEPDSPYFVEQKRELDQFLAVYVGALASSPLQRPVLEGFYRAMNKRNEILSKRAEDPEVPALGRESALRLLYSESDFQSAFGKAWYAKLREARGEPKFTLR